MIQIFKFLSVLVISISCTNSRKENLFINVSILDKIDYEKVEMDTTILEDLFMHVKFQPIKVDLTNNANIPLVYWTYSCSWQSNLIPDQKYVTWVVECPKNIPVLVKLTPHETKSFYGIVEINDFNFVNGSDVKFGFVLVRKNEVSEDGGFNPVLRHKIEMGKDIYWSNSISLDK